MPISLKQKVKLPSISMTILAKLKEDITDIQNCRGQAYGDAAVMAGQHTRVHIRIKETTKNADFVTCTNHSLNLVVHVASVGVDLIVTFFGCVESLFVFFSSSTHRWDVLTSVTGQSVKLITETRWGAWGEAVSVLKKHFC